MRYLTTGLSGLSKRAAWWIKVLWQNWKALGSNSTRDLAGHQPCYESHGDLWIQTWINAVINIGWVRLSLDNDPKYSAASSCVLLLCSSKTMQVPEMKKTKWNSLQILRNKNLFMAHKHSFLNASNIEYFGIYFQKKGGYGYH